jgi:hypothetical protein
VPSFQEANFPTIEEVMDLARSIVNDMYPGSNGAHGRILTDDAAFTPSYLNSAFRTVQRKLRNEGARFPIVDGFIIYGLPPVVAANPGVLVSVGFNGYNNGTQVYGALKLPSDCVNVQVVRQRQTGSNLNFAEMIPAQGGLPSGYQNNWLGMWEWRAYQIFMNGSLVQQDISLRYTQGQPPLNAPAADFADTAINIQDSQEALAYWIALQYGHARGASPTAMTYAQQKFDEAIDDMASEFVRQQQNITYRRESYQGGGSNNEQSTSLGSTGTVS